MTDWESNSKCDQHVPGDLIEEYALERLPAGDLLDRIEEHLLVCESCQNRLMELDALRAALSIIDKDEKDQRYDEPDA
jgi:hypothetical protein